MTGDPEVPASSGENSCGVHTIRIRVRYLEADPMGFMHHSHVLAYFEMGRTEALRAQGIAYRDVEARGVFIVVTRVLVEYRSPARYDDELDLETRITRATRARVDHAYRLLRHADGGLVVVGQSTLACLDCEGKQIAFPDDILTAVRRSESPR